MDNMVVIYLAAGIGRRLRPLTYKTNKVLLEFGGKSLIRGNLEILANLGVKEAVVVVGHFSYLVKKELGQQINGMRIRYIYNAFYPVTGGAHSLWLARNEFDGKQCIIMDGDHLIDSRLLKKLVDSPYEDCILVDDTTKLPTLTEESVIVGRRGLVKYIAWSKSGELFRMVEPSDVVGEAIIIVKLSSSASSSLSYEVDRHLREGSGVLEVITPLNLTFRRHDTWYVSTSGLPWIEIDFEDDLNRARKVIYSKIKR